jgi:DNA-binding SARP family transcriptional activator/tetratricopeptide (TPR) repeat protein
MHGDEEVSPGPPRQCALLAVLATRANRVVSRGELIESLWGRNPPASADAGVYTYIAGLRRILEPGRAVRGTDSVLVSSGSGYTLRLDPGGLDATTFEACLNQARSLRMQGDLDAASAALSRGLGLWRGTALAGAPGPFAESERRRLEELRAAMAEERTDVLLATGKHDEAVVELTALVAAYPLRERPRGLLMIALYRSGRQADALEVYLEGRRVLADELGLDPGSELKRIHEQVLAMDPALEEGMRTPAPDAPARPAVPAQASGQAPAQVPLEVAGFAGRRAELAALEALIPCDTGQTAVPVALVTGTAGVGKTALAIRFARRAAGHFPDGQLYVNLRGFDPSGSPMEATDALGAFFHALSVPPRRVSESLDAQTGLFRSLLEGRRMLVVLDNARTADQVRPLLPASPGCMVVVTSRSPLAGLVAAEGARPLALSVLTEAEARQVLIGRLGEDPVAAEPQAAAEVIRLCAGLPLALSVASARAAGSPALSLAALVTELGDAGIRLDALDVGDTTTDVRGVFSWSYRQLSGPGARMFQLLSLHPGLDLTVATAASLVGAPLATARGAIAELVSTSLLTEHSPGRFAFHDLLRAYAAEKARSTQSDDDLLEAQRRLLDYYMRAAHAAIARMYPSRHATHVPEPLQQTRREDFTTYTGALTWLEAEHQVLLAAAARAEAIGEHLYCWQLCWTLAPYLHRHGLMREYLATARLALTAAQGLGDPAILGRSLYDLGHAIARNRAYEEADCLLDRASDLFTRLGDRSNLAQVHHVRSLVLSYQGRSEEALAQARQALRMRRELGDLIGGGYAENVVGWSLFRLGRFREALEHGGRAVALLRQSDVRTGLADALDTVGRAHGGIGEHVQAIACLQEAVDVYREIGDPTGERTSLVALGDEQRAAGDYTGARQSWVQALGLAADHPHAEDAAQVAERLQQLDDAPLVPATRPPS